MLLTFKNSRNVTMQQVSFSHLNALKQHCIKQCSNILCNCLFHLTWAGSWI